MNKKLYFDGFTPQNPEVVEISIGEFDYANPDCLNDGIKECETATEAVEYAIEPAQKWQVEQRSF